MRWSRRWTGRARYWGEHVGFFSFLTGEKTTTPAETAVAAEATATPPPPAAADPAAVPADPLDTSALTAPPEPASDQPQVGPPDPAQIAALQGPIIEALKTVFDPEIPVDIYELGLIYDIVVDAERRVLVRMTLTSPACPSAQQLPSEVRFKVKALSEVRDAWVEVVWEPPWDKDRMSETAKLQLGFF
jgi:FeS assembly SUF system protein